MDEGIVSRSRSECIKAASTAEGQRRVEIMRRDDGLFYFEEMSQVAGDPPYDPDLYWMPTYVSGLHGSAEEAEREARSVLKWFAKLI